MATANEELERPSKKSRRLVLPEPRPFQRKLIEDTSSEIACVSATQIGKTFAYAEKLLIQCWTKPKIFPWWWVAPTYKQCVPGQRILYQFCSSAGIMRSGPRPPFRQHPAPPLVLENGAIIEFRTWDDPQNLMGDPISGAVVEEAGLLVPYAHAAISSRRSETLGPLWFIGNPGRITGPFRKVCRRAEARGHGFHKWSWTDKHKWLLDTNPEKAAAYLAFINEERDTIPEYEFRRLYEAAWTSDEAAVFRYFRELDGMLDEDDVEVKCYDAEGPRPAGDTQPRIAGLDVAQSVDWLACVGLGLDSGVVDWLLRFRGVSYPDAAQRLKRVQQTWNCTYVLEVNGPGEVLKHEFDRLSVRYVPFTTTSQSKQDIILKLAADLSPPSKIAIDSETGEETSTMKEGEERVVLSTGLAPLPYELEIFRYIRGATGTYRYCAPEGEHDDTVMALALANWGRAFASQPLIS